jgi:putative ABC transport system permease protein
LFDICKNGITFAAFFPIPASMIKNYWLIAWRNLRAGKGYSFINIVGLAVSLAVCMIVLLYVFEETTYDRQHPGANRLYRINTSFKSKVDISTVATSNANVAPGLKMDFAEVEASARLLVPAANNAITVLDYGTGSDHHLFYERKAYYVDSGFFDLFAYRFVQGDAGHALPAPNTAVITETLAKQLFGKDDPMGKTFHTVGTYQDCTYIITGVIRPLGPSHIDGALFLSMDNDYLRPVLITLTNWATANTFLTYFRLKPGTDPVVFEKKLNPFLRRHGNADIEAAGAERLLSMQRVVDIHLHSTLPYDISVNSHASYLYILGSITIFLLLIACVNFMNLSTARSQRRAREVGMRKVMGALRGSLMLQFLGESMLLSVLSLMLALALTQAFLPIFNTLAERQLSLLEYPEVFWWSGALTLFTGLLAGLYPAVYLSSFRPMRVLKGQLVNSLSVLLLRKGLVVFQFTISVGLILAALVIWQQLDYLTHQDLGFKKEQQLVIPLRTTQAVANFDALRQAVINNPNVLSAAGGTVYPGQSPFSDARFYIDGQTPADGTSILIGQVGYDYLETLGMTMLHGHAFSRGYPSDSTGFIFNETAIRKLGLDPATATGTVIHYSYGGRKFNFPIVGIVRDFNFQSLREPIHPYGFQLDQQQNYLFLHTKTTDYAALLRNLSTIWQRLNPGTPFEYSFMDQDFQRSYDPEFHSARIIEALTGLTIFIACLGLFGLAAFTAEQRVKEIGIRKVLGSSVGNIIALLSKDFIRLVGIAILIAIPLAGWVMHRWLQDFAYRVPLRVWVFAVAGMLAIGIALVTIASQAVKAAMASPVKSLRAE